MWKVGFIGGWQELEVHHRAFVHSTYVRSGTRAEIHAPAGCNICENEKSGKRFLGSGHYRLQIQRQN